MKGGVLGAMISLATVSGAGMIKAQDLINPVIYGTGNQVGLLVQPNNTGTDVFNRAMDEYQQIHDEFVATQNKFIADQMERIILGGQASELPSFSAETLMPYAPSSIPNNPQKPQPTIGGATAGSLIHLPEDITGDDTFPRPINEGLTIAPYNTSKILGCPNYFGEGLYSQRTGIYGEQLGKQLMEEPLDYSGIQYTPTIENQLESIEGCIR